MAAKIYGARWRLVRQIGEGGQSHVYLVEDLRAQFPESVLKRIRNPDRRGRFTREVTALRALRHKSVVPIIDSSSDGDDPMYIVMPHLKGGDLSKRAQHYKGSIDTALRIGIALGDALVHSHGKGITHRDLKPENVLFDDDNEPILADFGICWEADASPLTETGEIVGPRSFMAPELEAGSEHTTASCDLYSLAKVLYYVLSGGVILPRELLRDKRFDLFTGRGYRHECLGILLDRMLAPAALRIRTANEVLSELRRIEAWERQVGALHSPRVSSAMQRAVSEASQLQTTSQAESASRAQLKSDFEAVLSSLQSWLTREIEAFAPHNNTPGLIELSAETRESKGETFRIDSHIYVRPVFEVCLTAKCQELKGHLATQTLTIIVGREAANFGGFRLKSREVYVVIARDRGERDRSFVMTQRYARPHGRSAFHQDFLGFSAGLGLHFPLERWPAVAPELMNILQEGLETFLTHLNRSY